MQTHQMNSNWKYAQLFSVFLRFSFILRTSRCLPSILGKQNVFTLHLNEFCDRRAGEFFGRQSSREWERERWREITRLAYRLFVDVYCLFLSAVFCFVSLCLFIVLCTRRMRSINGISHSHIPKMVPCVAYALFFLGSPVFNCAMVLLLLLLCYHLFLSNFVFVTADK